MTAVGAVAASVVLLALLAIGVLALVRLVAGGIDDAVTLPARGRHRHPAATRSTRKETARVRAAA